MFEVKYGRFNENRYRQFLSFCNYSGKVIGLVLVCGKLNLCYISLLIYWGRMLKDYYDDEEI